MDRQKLEAAQTLTPLVVPAAKLVANHHLTLRHAEKQRDMELEIAERKQELQEDAVEQMENVSTGQRRTTQQNTGGGNAVMDLMEREDCSMCKSILREIDRYSGARREKAIAEYGTLKGVMDTAESEDEVREYIDQTEVLNDAMLNAM